MKEWIQIQWTTDDLKEAREIARTLIEKKLVACVNIIPQVESLYFWKDQVETDQEIEVLLKTKAHHFQAVKIYIENSSSYEVPAIVAFPIIAANSAYLEWMETVTQNVVD